MTTMILWMLLAIFGTVGLCFYYRAALRGRGSRPPGQASRVRYDVEVPPPRKADQFTLSCPRCGCKGPLEDLSLVGDSVDCPACEQPFVVLAPESTP